MLSTVSEDVNDTPMMPLFEYVTALQLHVFTAMKYPVYPPWAYTLYFTP